jgi:hypothetical protein
MLINGIEVDGAVFSANNMLGTFNAGPGVFSEMRIDDMDRLEQRSPCPQSWCRTWAPVVGVVAVCCRVSSVLQLLARLCLGSSGTKKLKVGVVQNLHPEHRELTYMATVDGIHALVNESNEFDSTLSSHNFGGQAALGYEVALSIWEPNIGHIIMVPLSGQGRRSHVKSKLEGMVPPGKLFTADKKYCDLPTKSLFEIGKTLPRLKFKRRAPARHEALNSRIKQFGCMENCWRHDRAKHVVLFEFCVMVIQYKLDCGEDHLFDVLPPP